MITRKQNIKDTSQARQMEKHVFQKLSGPYLILAVHLCGTLSIKAGGILRTCTRPTLVGSTLYA
jgi:hypothetical protein